MKPLKTGQLVKLRYIHDTYFNRPRRAKPIAGWHEMDALGWDSSRRWNTAAPASTKTQEYEKKSPQRLAIILEEAEEIDMDLYHKCWVLPHEGISWDGEFWFKREELEIIQQEEELQSAHQV